MSFEVKRRFLLGFLVLATMFLAWSLFFTDEKMEKLVYARDGEVFSEAVTVKQRKIRSLVSERLPMRSLIAKRRPSQPPPPSPKGPPGHIP